MKKTLCSLLIIAILMNFIMCSISYADGQKDGSSSRTEQTYLEDDAPISEESVDSMMNDGTVPTSSKENAGKVSTGSSMGGSSAVGAVLGYLAVILDIIPLQIQTILSIITLAPTVDINGNSHTEYWITIERIVFNKIPLFNINFFDTDGEYSIGSGEHEIILESNESNKNIKQSVAKMFMICRVIALAIALLVLIYIGIRMAISAVASDRAKYKKMLIAWVESVVLIFLLVYIMVIIMNLGEALLNIFYNIRCELSGDSFETVIVDSIFEAIFSSAGLKMAMYSIMYWILIFTQFKFFFLYIKRMLMVAFLIMIAPLITITYSIDKAGDGKAQAFGVWLSEFVMNILIQPLHAIVYIIFMFTAGEIAKYAPIIGLAFMMSLGTVEKNVKRLFYSGNLASLGGVNDFKKGK